MFENINKENLHHAYLLEGEGSVIVPELLKFMEKELKLVIRGNPDIWLGKFQTMSIDDARMIKETQSTKPISGDRRIFIIELNAVTHEAQNALLKVFEEPAQGTHFFIISPSSDIFLPTLRSLLLSVRPF